MKIEEQVISLELAKKLEKIGIVSSSLFYYVPSIFEENTYDIVYNLPDLGDKEYYSAYTCAEIGEMLPVSVFKKIEKIMYRYEFEILKEKRATGDIFYSVGYNVYIYEEDTTKYLEVFYDEKLTDVMARMLIYLIETKLIEVG